MVQQGLLCAHQESQNFIQGRWTSENRLLFAATVVIRPTVVRQARIITKKITKKVLKEIKITYHTAS